MLDQETKSLWSHILGRAMQGELKGAELEIIPAEMVTWEGWLRDHPETTVLNLRRTADDFTADFYSRPSSFVSAWTSGFQAYSVSFETLLEHPVLNFTIDGWPVVVTFEPGSTAFHLLSRKVGNRELYFVAEGTNLMRDKQTGTLWDRNTGLALEGELAGESLDHQPAIVSYTNAWKEFHPDNRTLTQLDDTGLAQ